MNIKKIEIETASELLGKYHGYGSHIGKVNVYIFGVYEDDILKAVMSFNPPAIGAAKCSSSYHYSVLSLTI